MTTMTALSANSQGYVDPARSIHWKFTLAAVASVFAHVAVGIAVFNQPLGRFDPAWLQSGATVYRVRRARMDVVVAPSPPASIGREQAADRPNLDSLSSALLAMNASPPVKENPILQLRGVDDARDSLNDLTGEAGPSETRLPKSVAAKLAGGVEVSLPKSPDTGGAGGGDRVGFGKTSGGSAITLLAQAGLIGGRNPQPPAPMLDTHAIDDKPRLADERDDQPDLTSPAIDFAALAVRESTHLEIPQHLDNDFTYLLYGLTPLKRLDNLPARGYFRVDIRTTRTLRKLRTMPKDVVFLIDTSGSIPQVWVDQIIAGISDALNSLNDGDRFNIVFFNEQPRLLSDQRIQPATRENIAAARAFLKAGRSKGYTDVNRAMSRLLVRDVEAQRVYDLILISDGRPTRGVMDTRELINLITRDNDLAAGIYCVGVGRRQNHEMLDFLAYRNKGFSVFVKHENEAPGMIRDLLSRLRYPIIKNVQVHAVGLDTPEQLFPHNLPDIHQGQKLALFGRFRVPSKFTMRLVGQSAGQSVDFTFTRDLAFAQSADKRLPYQWAFWKLHDLYDHLLVTRDENNIREQIDEMKHDYNLKTVY